MTCPYVYPIVFGGCPVNCPFRHDCPDCDCKLIYSNESFNNARRLAYALHCVASDPVAVQCIATALHYDVNQLCQDMVDIDTVTAAFADNAGGETDD